MTERLHIRTQGQVSVSSGSSLSTLTKQPQTRVFCDFLSEADNFIPGCDFVLAYFLSSSTTFLFGNAAPQYFGNPALSVYSIFRLFTIEGWYEMCHRDR